MPNEKARLRGFDPLTGNSSTTLSGLGRASAPLESRTRRVPVLTPATNTDTNEIGWGSVVNRSQTDRTLLIEHPNRTRQQFKLVGTEKPVEDTPEVSRFQIAVKAGETKSPTVKEERDVAAQVALTNGAEDQIRYTTSPTSQTDVGSAPVRWSCAPDSRQRKIGRRTSRLTTGTETAAGRAGRHLVVATAVQTGLVQSPKKA